MDSLKKYQEILKKVFQRHAKINIANMPNVKSELIIDANKKHFILMDIGWHEDEFIHDCIFHFEIKKGKVHGHKNATDFDVIQELIENGIDKKDIIITILEETDSLPTTQLEEAA